MRNREAVIRLSLRSRLMFISLFCLLWGRGFIRAEAIKYDDLVECGSEKAAKEKGLVRSEGKEYVVQEGDVLLFRFNVSK